MLNTIFEKVKADKETQLIVDLEHQAVTIVGSEESKFEINDYKRTCLINGYDDIDYLLSMKDKIEKYEKNSVYLKLIS